jgi:sarcosine oxidase gamma subunit
MEWARTHGIELPLKLYDVQPISEYGVIARVGNDEIILECTPVDNSIAKVERILQQPSAGVYRIEQQTVTIELIGKHAHPILAQTCGVNFSSEPAQRIVYTRVAGASCGVIVRQKDEQRIYRIWVDYSLAVYLWDCFCEIIKYLEDRQKP